MSDGAVPNFDRLIKTFEGIERIQLPYHGSPQVIAVNSDVSLSQIFGTSVGPNKNGSVRIKIPGADTEGTLFNGTWNSTPKIKLTKCEDLMTEEGSRTPEIDACLASV